MLENVVSALQEADQQAQERARSARKKAEKLSRPESLDEAYRRIMQTKLKDAEVAIVNLVFDKLRDGSLSRLKDGKLSKKEVFELYQVYREQERDAKRRYVIETRPNNYWIVQDYDMLIQVEEMLRDEPLTAWDTETTGLDIFNHKIVGYSVYMPNHDIAVYIPFGHTTGQQQVAEVDALDLARWYLSDPESRTIWHHYKFDGHMFLNHGINVANPWWDTQIVAKLLNEHESHRLKDLYAKYILRQPDKSIQFEDLFDDFKIYDKDVILSGIYAAGDAHKTYKLYEFQKPFIDNRDNLKTVWYNIEQKLLNVDLEMERTGFCIDQDRIEMLLEKYEPQLQEAERQLIEAFHIDDEFLKRMSKKLGREITEFNVNSPEQLAYLLYDELGIDETFGFKFKEKARSTASKVLDALCEDHEQLKPLLTYRTLNKLVTTYLKKIPQAIEPATGRLHSRFNNGAGEDDSNSGAATGRYSSSSYVSGKNSATGNVAKGTNLQNIPAKGIGKEIRKCFVPDEGWVLISADLSQIEPRIVAHILSTRYGDHSMRDTYLAGKDIYTGNAMDVFGLEEKYCVDGALDPTGTFEPRKLMKQGVLSYLYGSSYKSFARNMKVSEEVAKHFFDSMIKAFPGLARWRQDIINKLMHRGSIAYAESLFGRKRRFPEYRKNKAELMKLEQIPYKKLTEEQRKRRNQLWAKCASDERAAANMEVQGTAADVLKMIMTKMYEFIKANGFKLHASIHDELIPSIPKEKLTPQVIDEITEIMTKTVTLCVPLKTDIVIMPRWSEDYKPEEWDFERGCSKSKEVA